MSQKNYQQNRMNMALIQRRNKRRQDEADRVVARGSCKTAEGMTYWSATASGVLTVFGVGPFQPEAGVSPEIRHKIKFMIVSNGVTSIGPSACRGMSQLRTVMLSKTVREIGPKAFRDCESLESISDLHNVLIGQKAFDDNKKARFLV